MPPSLQKLSYRGKILRGSQQAGENVLLVWDILHRLPAGESIYGKSPLLPAENPFVIFNSMWYRFHLRQLTLERYSISSFESYGLLLPFRPHYDRFSCFFDRFQAGTVN
jgi:hypothetical protein